MYLPCTSLPTIFWYNRWAPGLTYTSTLSPHYLPYISPMCPLYLPGTSLYRPISPLYLPFISLPTIFQ